MNSGVVLALAAGLVVSAAHMSAADAGEARGWKVFDTVDEMTDEAEWYAVMVPEEEIGADGDLKYPTIDRLMRVDCADGIPRVIVQFAASTSP